MLCPLELQCLFLMNLVYYRVEYGQEKSVKTAVFTDSQESEEKSGNFVQT